MQALAADPDDPRALRLLALLAEDEGDFDGARRTRRWRWLHADPLSHEAFRLIGRLLADDPAQAARAAAYQALGNEKLHFDPESRTGDPAPLLQPIAGRARRSHPRTRAASAAARDVDRRHG